MKGFLTINFQRKNFKVLNLNLQESIFKINFINVINQFIYQLV